MDKVVDIGIGLHVCNPTFCKAHNNPLVSISKTQYESYRLATHATLATKANQHRRTYDDLPTWQPG